MAEDAIATTSIASSPQKARTKASSAVKSKSRPTANHPKVADMVNAAIVVLKQRDGSSVQAIKKYMATTYKVDSEKMAPFIKKYLKTAVTNGLLVQTKGKGASGSFKLGPSAKEKKAAAKQGTKEKFKKTTSVTVKKPTAKKTPSKTMKKLDKRASIPKSKKTKATPSAKDKKPKPSNKPKTSKPKKATRKTSPKKK